MPQGLVRQLTPGDSEILDKKEATKQFGEAIVEEAERLLKTVHWNKTLFGSNLRDDEITGFLWWAKARLNKPDPMAVFVVVSITRSEIAQALNDVIELFVEDNSKYWTFAPNDDRLTDAVCQKFAEYMKSCQEDDPMVDDETFSAEEAAAREVLEEHFSDPLWPNWKTGSDTYANWAEYDKKDEYTELFGFNTPTEG